MQPWLAHGCQTEALDGKITKIPPGQYGASTDVTDTALTRDPSVHDVIGYLPPLTVIRSAVVPSSSCIPPRLALW